jgi:transcriptional regulator with XRE-family HTH domain
MMAFKSFLRDMLRRKKLRASHLAAKLGISHATVSRWMSGKDKPSVRSCAKLAKYSGLSIEQVLRAAGYISPEPVSKYVNLPEFAEYARLKYADELDEDMIMMVEDLIERRRTRNSDL